MIIHVNEISRLIYMSSLSKVCCYIIYCIIIDDQSCIYITLVCNNRPKSIVIYNSIIHFILIFNIKMLNVIILLVTNLGVVN